MKSKLPLSREYVQFVSELKTRIQSARISAAQAVNRDLILLYWDIGRGILERQEKLGWGKNIVEDLARDLQAAFPDSQGFSPRNLWYMRCLYAEYSASEILQQLAAELAKMGTASPKGAAPEKLQQLVAEIPWGHHMLLLDRIKDPVARLYYLRATAKLGWSRNVLLNQIKARAYERSLADGKTHNFPAAGVSRGAGGGSTQELIQPRVPGYPAGGEGTRVRGPADRTLAAVHFGAGLRLLLHRTTAPAGAWQKRILHRLAILPPFSQGAGGGGIEDRAVRAGVCGQDGFLPQFTERQRENARRQPIHWNHLVRGERRHRGGIFA